MTDENKETNVVSIDKRARMRGKQRTIRKMFERDVSLWPDTATSTLDDTTIMNCQIMGIASAKELYMDYSWDDVLNAILMGLSEAGMSGTEVFAELQQANQYWKECCFTTEHNGATFEKVGSALTISLDGVILYSNPDYTEKAKNIQPARFFVNGYHKGHTHGKNGTLYDRLNQTYELGKSSENYVTIHYTMLLVLLSEHKVGNDFGIRPTDISTMSVSTWSLIIDALRSGDMAFLKNYPRRLIALVLTIAQFGTYTQERIGHNADFLAYWKPLLHEFFGWDVEVENESIWVRLSPVFAIPHCDSIIGYDKVLIKYYRQVWDKEPKGEI